MSASSLHRESTDSLIFILQCFGMQATLALQVLYYAVALVGDTFLSMLMCPALFTRVCITSCIFYTVHTPSPTLIIIVCIIIINTQLTVLLVSMLREVLGCAGQSVGNGISTLHPHGEQSMASTLPLSY